MNGFQDNEATFSSVILKIPAGLMRKHQSVLLTHYTFLVGIILSSPNALNEIWNLFELKVALTLNDMESEKSTSRYSGWSPLPTFIVWKAVEIKFCSVKVCHGSIQNHNIVDDIITDPLLLLHSLILESMSNFGPTFLLLWGWSWNWVEGSILRCWFHIWC